MIWWDAEAGARIRGWAGAGAAGRQSDRGRAAVDEARAGLSGRPRPGNDAVDMAAALRRLGFDVTTLRDADRGALTEALRAFTRESAGADVSLVFYAGHGLEMDGVNYLVPVDARLERDTDVRFEALELDDVLASTAGAGLRVVILDACRNNPLAGSMQRTSARRSVSRGSFGELDEALLGDETLVAYAAAAGTTAADGTGRNSPYTLALLAHLEQPLEIGLLFREVRARVLEDTDGEQRPHEYASLLREHYLGGASGAATVTVVGNVSDAALVEQETVFWNSIRDSSNPAEFEAYLKQYPAGAFRALATVRLTALRGSATAGPAADRERNRQAVEGLQRGIRHVEDGDYGQAIAELEDATIELEATRASAADIARAYFYVGVAYMVVVGDDEAVFAFREAQHQDPAFRPSEREYPRRLIILWERARAVESEPEFGPRHSRDPSRRPPTPARC